MNNFRAESEKEMMNRTVVSEEKQSHLAEEAKRITKEYELALEEHLASEKVSRSKRFKAETQLQNWLIKFDQDIGERQAEYETFKKRFVSRRSAKRHGFYNFFKLYFVSHKLCF